MLALLSICYTLDYSSSLRSTLLHSAIFFWIRPDWTVLDSANVYVISMNNIPIKKV